MAVSSSRRLDFEPDIVTTDDSTQAPSLPSLSALARFEFESGRGNEGTKILMVEWSDSDDDGESTGDWEVSWEGKTTTLSTRASEGLLHRTYFLLGPGTSIPSLLKLSQAGGKSIQVNPLPAIFPPELGVSATIHGRKGVLHTLWAKKRLSALQQEIELEMKNGEGVGLEIAIQEKQWIEENFGVSQKTIPDLQFATSPTSPKTPGGGRLAEKLKGLKLGTAPSDLTTASAHDISKSGNNPLSPDLGDVAVSSFSTFHGNSRPTRPIAQTPPPQLLVKQSNPAHSNRIASLDAMTSGQLAAQDETETGDELFAVKLSPRSPDMTKSPFSFSSKDTTRLLQQDK